MRKLIRILTGVAVIGAFVLIASPPASANHDADGPNWPCTSSLPPCTGADATRAYHEEMPDLAIVNPADACVVTGQIIPGTTTTGGPQHSPVNVPLVNVDPAHSHFTFVDAIIDCLGTGDLAVAADGGNDGHMVDLMTPAIEADPVTSDAPQHPFNDHHGSTNESAWSNSSDYSGASGTQVQGGGHSNACGDSDGPDAGTANDNDNKFDISVTNANGTEKGWGKYDRVGIVAFVWGCFKPGGGPVSGTNPFFNALLLVTPDVSPVAVPPFLPGGASPTCILPGSTPACGFLITGVATRGPSWLVDGESLPTG